MRAVIEAHAIRASVVASLSVPPVRLLPGAVGGTAGVLIANRGIAVIPFLYLS